MYIYITLQPELFMKFKFAPASINILNTDRFTDGLAAAQIIALYPSLSTKFTLLQLFINCSTIYVEIKVLRHKYLISSVSPNLLTYVFFSSINSSNYHYSCKGMVAKIRIHFSSSLG